MKKYGFILLIFAAAGCSELDVIGRDSPVAFSRMADSASVKTAGTDDYLTLTLPEGEVFAMQKKFSSPGAEIYLSFDASGFTASGLRTAGLPGNYSHDPESGLLKISFSVNDDRIEGSDIKELFRSIVANKREIVGYHEDLDHYGIELGGGNAVEWAKDMSKNDLDFVFVLNPEPFISAGLDTGKPGKWKYGKVRIRDEKGKTVEVYKLLRAYNLE